MNEARPARGEFERWLEGVVRATGAWNLRPVRQSSRDRREYVKHVGTATLFAANDPDVAAIRELDIGKLLDGKLRSHPSFRIEMRHLPGGGPSRAFVGTAVAVGETVFLFILNSAADNNLTGTEIDNGGNAFTAAVQTAVRRMSLSLWQTDIRTRVWVHFFDASRLARDPRHAADLLETLRWAMAYLRIRDSDYENLRSEEAKTILTIFTAMSAGELQKIVDRLTGPKFGLLSAGVWLGGEAPPFTHELATEEVSDGIQTWIDTDPHTLVPRADAVETLTRLVDTILVSAGDRVELGRAGINPDPEATPNWQEVTEVAGQELGIESRSWVHINRGGLAIHRLANGPDCLRRYLETRWIEGWRTGRTPFDMKVPHVIASEFDLELSEHQEWIDRPDGTRAVRTRMEMPRPELPCPDAADCRLDGHLDEDGRHLTHSFGIPDWKWNRLSQLLDRTSQRAGQRGFGSDSTQNIRHPLVSTFQWEEDGKQSKLLASSSSKRKSVYQLYERDAAPNPNRAWYKGPDQICRASIVAQHLHVAVATDLIEALDEVDRQLVPLSASGPDQATRPGAQTDVEEELRSELERTEEEARQARRVRLIARAEHQEAQETCGPGSDQLREAKADLAEAEQMHEEAQAALREARHEVAQRAETASDRRDNVETNGDGRVDLSNHAVVATLLSQVEGSTDRVLNDVLRQLIDSEQSRVVVHDDDHRRVTVRPVWRMIDADTGEVVNLSRSFDVERLPANPQTKSKNVDMASRNRTVVDLILAEGLSRTEVGNRFRIQFRPGKPNDYGFQIVREWLDAHGVTRAFHEPLIDSPPVVRRALYLALTQDQAELQQLLQAEDVTDEWSQLLVDRYTAGEVTTRGSWPSTWVPARHTHDRAVVGALEREGGRARIDRLASMTGLLPDEIAATAHLVMPSHRHLASPRFAQPPSVVKGEWRGQKGRPLTDRELWLMQCPHNGCGGLVTRPLWTPETDPPLDADADLQVASLCPSCRRTPWSPIRFPATYLRAWSGPVGREGGKDTRKTTIDNDEPSP